MDDTKKLLIVRVPTGDIPALEAMRGYVQASLQMGVLAVPEDTTLELMELPPLGWVMSAEYYQAVDELFTEAEVSAPPPVPRETAPPAAETITFMGQGAGEKKEIYTRMRRYRQAHGLGCWQTVAELAGKDVTADLLRGITIGAESPPIKVWRKINSALDALESREEKTT